MCSYTIKNWHVTKAGIKCLLFFFFVYLTFVFTDLAMYDFLFHHKFAQIVFYLRRGLVQLLVLRHLILESLASFFKQRCQ